VSSYSWRRCRRSWASIDRLPRITFFRLRRERADSRFIANRLLWREIATLLQLSWLVIGRESSELENFPAAVTVAVPMAVPMPMAGAFP